MRCQPIVIAGIRYANGRRTGAIFLAMLAGHAAAVDGPDGATKAHAILVRHCIACHGPEVQKSGLRLDVRDRALQGGDLGPALIPGKAMQSPLYRYVAGLDPNIAMPPEGPQLATSDQEMLRSWIDAGAAWPKSATSSMQSPAATWWAFRPLMRPAIPTCKPAESEWVRNPIDAFVMAKLRERGLRPSPSADSRTLARRLHFDFIGLPPSKERLDRFAAQSEGKSSKEADAAYGRLVDELLASPHFGERWARHWLDVVRFGETHGYDKDKPRPNSWPYRDYVIRAFNEDKPFGRFVREQIAGDALYPHTVDGVVALGFLAAGPWDFIGHAELPESKIDGAIARHLDRDDMVSNAIGTFLGLTAHCAQCHDHKFDPISQAEYYGLQSVFAAVDRTERPFYEDAEVSKRASELLARKQGIGKRLKAILREVEGLGGPELAALDVKIKAAKADKATVQKLQSTRLALLKHQCSPGLRDAWQLAEKELAAVDKAIANMPRPQFVYAAGIHSGSAPFTGTGATGGKPRPIFVLARGDVRRPGRAASPGGLSCLGMPSNFATKESSNEAQRRMELANWLASRDNPLVWRVMANRLWQYHFGTGLVETPNDFGKMGQPPTHPELLDWLAIELRDGGESLKHVHRLLAMSATYRQASVANALGLKMDKDNRFYWRGLRRKLEAEAVRDAILTVAGKLDRMMGGPSFQDFKIERPEHSPHYQYHLHDPNDPKTHRRSIYRFTVRSKPEPAMAALDCADPSMSVDVRNQSQTPQQALALFNGPLAVAMAEHFAARVRALANDPRSQVRVAFELALSRTPEEAELRALHDFAAAHGLAALCRALFNANEFAFVD